MSWIALALWLLGMAPVWELCKQLEPIKTHERLFLAVTWPVASTAYLLIAVSAALGSKLAQRLLNQ